MRRGAIGVGALLLLIGGLAPSGASSEPRAYRGPHPIDAEGRWHAEVSVHVHDTLPVGLEPFGWVDGVLVFLADPEVFRYGGTIYEYSGVHPLPARYGQAYCGLSGTHAHPFAPEGDYQRLESGEYDFRGAQRGGVPTVTPGRVGLSADEQRRRDEEEGLPIYSGEVPPDSSGNNYYFWYGGPRPRPCPYAPCRPPGQPGHRPAPSSMRAPQNTQRSSTSRGRATGTRPRAGSDTASTAMSGSPSAMGSRSPRARDSRGASR